MIDRGGRGSLSVDFLISITASCLLLMFVILTAFTFSLVEVAQYIAYATARSYFVGHENYDAHIDEAEDRYNSLNGQFFNSGSGSAMSSWFFLSGMNIYDGGVNVSFQQDNRTRFGVGFTFTSRVLTMDIPFLGKVGSGTDGFAFPIASFLGREVSKSVCRDLFPPVDPFGKRFIDGGNGC